MVVMQTKSFAGKVALVTGGSKGIGAGIVRRLARDGFGVHHLKAVVLIMVSAAAGAVLRRTLARYSANTLL